MVGSSQVSYRVVSNLVFMTLGQIKGVNWMGYLDFDFRDVGMGHMLCGLLTSTLRVVTSIPQVKVSFDCSAILRLRVKWQILVTTRPF